MGCSDWMKKLKLTELAQHNLKSSWRSKRYIMLWRQYLMCRLVRAQTCSSRQDTTAASEATSASGISSHSPPLLSNLSMSVLYWVSAFLCEFPSIWWSPSYVSRRRHQTVLLRFIWPAVHFLKIQSDFGTKAWIDSTPVHQTLPLILKCTWRRELLAGLILANYWTFVFIFWVSSYKLIIYKM